MATLNTPRVYTMSKTSKTVDVTTVELSCTSTEPTEPTEPTLPRENKVSDAGATALPSNPTPASISRKPSFVNGLEQSYSYLGRIASFVLVTLVCFVFVFVRGRPLLQYHPNFSFSPSAVHFQWVGETSDSCVSLLPSGDASPASTPMSNTTAGQPLMGGYLFVVHRHEQMVIAVLSLLLDMVVLKYHFTHEPHPKFRLSKTRKICIYTHLIGGASEILLSFLAFLTGMAAVGALAAIPALLCQTPTAMYQTYSVFGSKRVLIPVAQLANAMHVFAAVRLLGDPLNTEALLSMILILHLYVWARAFYHFLNHLRIMREASYTLSIALSGILVIPSALEFIKPLHIFGSVLIYNLTILIATNASVCGGDPFLYV